MSKVCRKHRVFSLAVCLALAAVPAFGQGVHAARSPLVHAPLSTPAMPAGTGDALLDLASRAAVIFAGRVEAIDREDAAGYVDIRFHVDEPLRGCPKGKNATYVLREWAGLWTGQAPRYRVGARLLMLLTARGPSGMSSPVNGLEGAIPLAPTAQEPLADGTGVAPAEDGSTAAEVAQMSVDLRWVQAHATRSVAAGASAAASLLSSVAGAQAAGASWAGPVSALATSAAVTDKAAARPTVASILSLLDGGSGVSHEAR